MKVFLVLTGDGAYGPTLILQATLYFSQTVRMPDNEISTTLRPSKLGDYIKEAVVYVIWIGEYRFEATQEVIALNIRKS